MLYPDYAKNLRLLCDEYGTISGVCRDLGINRQQFNKYLSGKILPSNHNQRRIEKFFNIDTTLLFLSHDDFLIHLTTAAPQSSHSNGQAAFFEKMVSALPNDIEKLRRYLGYYYLWFYSIGFKGHIVKALVSVYEQDGVVYTKTIEHLSEMNGEVVDSYTFKYTGTVFYLSGRIFILEYEMLTKTTVNLAILNSSYRSKITTLHGITMGVSSAATREPAACRVEWEYLGKEIDIREALKSCQLYKPDSEFVDPQLKSRISNEVAPEDFLLYGFMN
ncbi:MAG: helix-turn-helix domain-containing protein [Arenicella sp.]